MRLTLGQPEISDSTNILEVVVPDELRELVPTGHPQMDFIFSKTGVTPSSSIFITGIPGSGKTTSMLQLADAITTTGNIAIYNTAEESLYQVRKTIERLELKNGFIPGYDTYLHEILNRANEICEANKDKKIFLFVDSLQCIDIAKEPGQRGRGPGKLEKQIKVIEGLTAWAKETFNVVFTIGHVNKKGEFAGSQSIKHIIDVHLHLGVDLDKKSETCGEPAFIMLKNRFGHCGTYPYTITDKGIVFPIPIEAQIIAEENKPQSIVLIERTHVIE